MNDDFKIGEVVVCVNARRRWYKLGGLKRNEMYTISGFNPYDGGLILKEAKSPRSGYNAYRADRFRKLDYKFAESTLSKLQTAMLELAVTYDTIPRLKFTTFL